MHVDNLIKKYESMTTNIEKLPDDLKITIMIDLCHKDLREHLEMSTKDLELKGTRDEILNYVDRKGDVVKKNFNDMDCNCFESWENQESWETEEWYPTPEELSWIGKGLGQPKGEGKTHFCIPKGGFGKGKSKGKGKRKAREKAFKATVIGAESGDIRNEIVLPMTSTCKSFAALRAFRNQM